MGKTEIYITVLETVVYGRPTLVLAELPWKPDESQQP